MDKGCSRALGFEFVVSRFWGLSFLFSDFLLVRRTGMPGIHKVEDQREHVSHMSSSKQNELPSPESSSFVFWNEPDENLSLRLGEGYFFMKSVEKMNT